MLQNFSKLLTDQNFIQSLGNTFKFVIITAPVVVVFALILALLANREWRGRRFLRVAYYIPVSYTHLDVYKRQAFHIRLSVLSAVHG